MTIRGVLSNVALTAFALSQAGSAGAQKADGAAQGAAIGVATTWTRVNVTVPYPGEVGVLTVPATATKPHFLRQTYTNVVQGSNFPISYAYCTLFVNGSTALQLMSGAITDLNVPFRAADEITLRCNNPPGGDWTFVFSN